MSTITVEYSAIINAKPADVYAVFCDYHTSHPAILPKPTFETLTVTEGGTGAGTKFSATMNMFGSKSTINMVVTEPKPGHTLMEEDAERGLKTWFIHDAVENGQKTRVTLRTEARQSKGVQGWIEKLVMGPALRSVYKKELANVETYIAGKK